MSWADLWFHDEYGILLQTNVLVVALILQLSSEDKLKLMGLLNWDYLDTPDEILAVVEGCLGSSGAFRRDNPFVRSLERLPWHYITAL